MTRSGCRRAAAFGASVLACLYSGPLLAQDQNSVLRLGLAVGAPMGLSAAMDLAQSFGLHLGLSPPSDRTQLGTRLDFVYRPGDLGGEVASLGVGRFWFGAGVRWTLDEESQSSLGLRVPFGFSFFADSEAAEIFAEIAPALAVYPERQASVEAGLGLRLSLF